VTVGARVIVMEQAVLRGTRRQPLVIEDDVLIGPHAHLSGCRVGRESFIATGVSIFNGAVVEPGSEIQPNGVLQVRSRIVSGASIPIGWVRVGDPAEILPSSDHARIEPIQRGREFSRTVFGLPREAPLADVNERYVRACVATWPTKSSSADRDKTPANPTDGDNLPAILGRCTR
jgi:carbonic anhydrase/acetyltransferase-like protein (isoleucine patch superfamily)